MPRQVGDRQQRRDRAGDHPAAAVPGRQHLPAHHRQPVEDRQQHRRGAHVAGDQRQPEQRAGEEDDEHRDRGQEREPRARPRVPPGEREADRDADDQRLAQRVAEVLGRPVRAGERVAAAVGGLGEVGGAVQRVQRVAGHRQVRERPQHRGERGQPGVGQPLAVARAAPQVERVEAGQRPRLRPHQPGEREQEQDRDAAPGLPRLQQHRPHDHDREGGVLVADQRVALERRPRQHDQRRDHADPGREQLRAEPVGEPHQQPEAQQRGPQQDRVAARPERHRDQRDERLQRVRRGRERRLVVRGQTARDVSCPQKCVSRVVVQEPRCVNDLEQNGDADDRPQRGQEPEPGAHPRRR